MAASQVHLTGRRIGLSLENEGHARWATIPAGGNQGGPVARIEIMSLYAVKRTEFGTRDEPLILIGQYIVCSIPDDPLIPDGLSAVSSQLRSRRPRHPEGLEDRR